MKKFALIPLAFLALCAGCSKNDGGEDPTPNPGPQPPPSVSVWDGKSATEPFDLNWTAKTATIMLASDLAWLSEKCNEYPDNTFAGWTFTLGQDLDMAGKKWTPIGNWMTTHTTIFKGSFYGNGHSITGLYVDNPEKDNAGLFGVVQNSVIKGLKVAGTIRGKNHVGGICANAQISARIEDCVFSGKVESAKQEMGYMCIGGICGRAETTVKILNCHSSATIVYGSIRELFAGGIIGMTASKNSEFEIHSCSFSGTFEKGYDVGGKSYVGGIGGKMTLCVISGCKNSADITIEGDNQIFLGGIAGFTEKTSSTIQGCYNTGAITNNSTFDGLTGGITGALDETCYISACYNRGKITPASVTENEAENYDINFWKQGNAILLDCFYVSDKPEGPGLYRFTANQWPAANPRNCWNIGNDPKTGKFWKSLGTPGTTDYPTLWWE